MRKTRLRRLSSFLTNFVPTRVLRMRRLSRLCLMKPSGKTVMLNNFAINGVFYRLRRSEATEVTASSESVRYCEPAAPIQ